MTYPIPTRLSPTGINKFSNCGLAWKLKYIDKLPEVDSRAMLVGNIVHDALFRFYYERSPRLRTPENLEEALLWACAEEGHDFGDDIWDDVWKLSQNIFKVEDPKAVKPMGCELSLEAPLVGHDAIGIIDRLDLEADGSLTVVDFKTGKVPQPRDYSDRLQGVMLYALLVEKLLGVRPKKVKLIYLSKPAVVEAEPTEQILRGLQMRLGAIWSAIENACETESFSPRVTPLCSWCSYQAICSAWQ